jgi:hypothetical protein
VSEIDRSWVDLFVSKMCVHYKDIQYLGAREPAQYGKIVNGFKQQFELSNVKEIEAMEAIQICLLDGERKDKKGYPVFSELMTYIRNIRNRKKAMGVPRMIGPLEGEYKLMHEELTSIMSKIDHPKYVGISEVERGKILGNWIVHVIQKNGNELKGINPHELIYHATKILLRKLKEKYDAF